MNMLSTEVETSHDPEGYDVPAVEAWIRDRIDGVCTPLKWTRLLGGHSNLTYRVDSQNGLSAVIRRPPRGELLPKAHDMGREWAVITALAPTAVPVPQGYAFCEGPDVTGAWFYLMELLDGHPLYNLEDTNEWVPQSKREQLACSFIDILADLHALDPDEIGLGDLGKKEGYVARQVRTWYRSWMSSIEAAQYDDDRAHELQRFFIGNVPEQGKARRVHGDYGLHNCLVGPNCTVAAVVDWEISTLGDPLADLGYALNQWPACRDEIPGDSVAATSAPGFPPQQVLVERYAERTGRDLSKLDYYLAFNRWKTAAINHGVYARYMAGQKSTEGIDLDGLVTTIDTSLTLSAELVGKIR
jgi:aminoglycoside phosphotransferase (APT) family kinase protein